MKVKSLLVVASLMGLLFACAGCGSDETVADPEIIKQRDAQRAAQQPGGGTTDPNKPVSGSNPPAGAPVTPNGSGR